MIEIRDLRFRYREGGFALAVSELGIAAGERVALVGPSGSGKTTLISLVAGILRPDAGSIRVGDVRLEDRNDRQLREFRISNIGFVFQEFELLDYLCVGENILLPYYLNAALELSPEARRAAESLAAGMGLADKLRRHPATLSQGERQRVAICRALVTAPRLLIADEPTGNLDPLSAAAIVDLLVREAERRGATLLTVTHNHALLDAFDRTIDVAGFLAEAG